MMGGFPNGNLLKPSIQHLDSPLSFIICPMQLHNCNQNFFGRDFHNKPVKTFKQIEFQRHRSINTKEMRGTVEPFKNWLRFQPNKQAAFAIVEMFLFKGCDWGWSWGWGLVWQNWERLLLSVFCHMCNCAPSIFTSQSKTRFQEDINWAD